MAVAVEKVVEQPVRPSTPMSLADASLAGTVYTLVAAFLAYHGVPYLWDTFIGPQLGLSGLIDRTLAVTLSVAVAVGAIVVWHRAGPKTEGLRAGIAVGVAWVLVGMILTYVGTR